MLLPLLALFLLVVMNNSKILGQHRNGWKANTLGLIAVIVIATLGASSLYSVFWAS